MKAREKAAISTITIFLALFSIAFLNTVTYCSIPYSGTACQSSGFQGCTFIGNGTRIGQQTYWEKLVGGICH